ncbi:hypothetical protein ES705_15841 [subsurface metagenome]
MGLCVMCGRRTEDGMQISGDIVCITCFEELQTVRKMLRAGRKEVGGLKMAWEILHKTYSGGDLVIRDIPEGLVNKALRRADKDGDSLRDLTVKAMQAYLMEKGGK